jgi:hypothetical protein
MGWNNIIGTPAASPLIPAADSSLFNPTLVQRQTLALEIRILRPEEIFAA